MNGPEACKFLFIRLRAKSTVLPALENWWSVVEGLLLIHYRPRQPTILSRRLLFLPKALFSKDTCLLNAQSSVSANFDMYLFNFVQFLNSKSALGEITGIVQRGADFLIAHGIGSGGREGRAPTNSDLEYQDFVPGRKKKKSIDVLSVKGNLSPVSCRGNLSIPRGFSLKAALASNFMSKWCRDISFHETLFAIKELELRRRCASLKCHRV